MRKYIGIIAIFVVSVCALGQVSVSPLLQPHQEFTDASGAPCAGCALFSYTAGSTIPTPTYKDAGGTIPNTNPIVLSVQGGADIWVNKAVSYKFVLKNTSGTTLWTVDSVRATGADTISNNPAGSQGITQPPGTNFGINTSGGGKFTYNGSEVLNTSTGVQTNPTGNQTVTQPSNTTLAINDATIANMKAKGNPWFDISAYGAVSGGADSGTPIRTAIAAAISAGGGTVFFPCGTWNIATPADGDNYAAIGIYPGTAKLTLRGASHGCAKLVYTGTTAVQAVINMAYSKPPSGGSTPWKNDPGHYFVGSNVMNLTISGTHTLGFNISDGIDLIRPGEMIFSHVIMGNQTQTNCLYVISGVANKFDTPICDRNNGSWSGGFAPTNGLVFDGYAAAGDASTTSTIDVPSIEGVLGIGLWLADANNFTVTGMQIGSNVRNLQIDSASNTNLFTGLLETVGSNTSNILVSGGYNTFDSVLFASSGGTNKVEIAGPQNSIRNSAINNGTIQINAESAATKLASIGLFGGTSTVVDNGIGTMQESPNIPDQGTDLSYNTPQFQHQTPQSASNILPGAHFDAQGVAHGTWFAGFSSPAVPILTASNYTPNKSWSAILIGSFTLDGVYVNQATFIERSDTAPTITVGGSTLVLGVGPTNHQFVMFSSDSHRIGFSGWVYFMPNNAFAAGTVSFPSVDVIGNMKIVGFDVPVTAAGAVINRATCVKSVGPPVLIGICSSAVAASGACTCN